MAKVTFQKDLCKGCGLCIAACPKGILELSRDEITNTTSRIPIRIKSIFQLTVSCPSSMKWSRKLILAFPDRNIRMCRMLLQKLAAPDPRRRT